MSDAGKTELSVPATITPEFLQSVLAGAAKAGLTVPGPEQGVPDAPTLRLEWGWRRLGHELGGILRSRNIFRKVGELGRVNEATGAWEAFTPHNFAGWVEEFAAFTWKGDKTSLIAEHSRMLMAQFTFLAQIRELEGIHPLSLPVMRADGTTEWLAPGYDGPTKIFTVETIDYASDWTVEQANDFLAEWCGDFPWMWGDGQDGMPLRQNRSFSAHVSAMIGVYCRAMVEAGCLRPMFVYNANQQGSGKSTSAQMAFIPVFGLTATNDMPKSDDEMTKELASAAQAFTPFLFLDDLGTQLHSNKLNRFITSPRHAGRIIGTKERFDVPNVTQVFATGNNVTGSRDLARRAIIVEMFYAGDLTTRKFKRRITPHTLAKPGVRKDFLSALCALVKHWTRATDAERELLDKIEPMPSFDEWSKLVASIVIFAGYSNPLAPPLTPFDESDDQVKALLIAAASAQEMAVDIVFNREQLVAIAREKELLEDIVGTGDKELDPKANKRFGIRLRACRGLEMIDTQGRRFRFGHRRQKTGATYPLTFI